MIKLVLRNVARNMRRSLWVLFVLFSSMGLLFVGNAMLDSANSRFQAAYVGNLTGDISVSQENGEDFTLLGNQELFVGQYKTPPVLVGSATVVSTLENSDRVNSTASVLVSVARLELEDERENVIVHGVDFGEYFGFMDGIDVLSSLDGPRSKGIYLQESMLRRYSEKLGREVQIGEVLYLSSSFRQSFAIREVPLLGVYRYSVSDAVTDRLALVDSDTARALNGMLYATVYSEQEDDAQGLNAESFDGLFSTVQSTDAEEETVDPLSLFSGLPSDTPSEASKAGGWNFVLLKTDLRPAEVLRLLGNATDARGLQVRDWRQSIGGNVHLVTLLQIVLNAGLLFISFGTVLIAGNAIVLSILERTREFGTMRALGAEKGRVVGTVLLEGLVLVGSTALTGILFGVVAVAVINWVGLEPDNQFVANLFGGGRLRIVYSVSLLFWHILGALLVGFASATLPLRGILRITPLEAMNKP